MISNFDSFRAKLEALTLKYESKIELPEFDTLSNEILDGVSNYEGYQRGWGLQFSAQSKHFASLVDQIISDDLYQFAFKAAKRLSVVSQQNRMNQFLIVTQYLNNIEAGDWIEFGSYKGGNAIFLAIVSKVLGFNNTIYACDSFAGMPKTDKSLDLHNEGDFADVDIDWLQNYIHKLGLDNLVLVKGFFSESLQQGAMQDLKFSFAHIDCDIYSACEDAYEYLKQNRLVNMGYLVFDDACVSSCIGATRFVEKSVIRRDGYCSEQIWPHFVFRIS